MNQTTVLGRLGDLIAEHYVFPEIGSQIVSGLPDHLQAADPDEIAAELTACIQVVNRDLHLRVRVRPSGALEGVDDWEAHYAADAVRNAGGISRVERLTDNVGLLAIAPYTSPVHLAQRYVVAAFDLLDGVDRLVLDLRDGLGGTPETVALICGYLLGREPVHLQDIVDRDGTARQYWTSPTAGRLREDVAISVLIGAQTFSGCEELAYNLQSLQRATIFGERSRGGAHPVEVFALTDVLEIVVPVARSVNAVTGTNWEQTGVVPDVPCPETEALERALRRS